MPNARASTSCTFKILNGLMQQFATLDACSKLAAMLSGQRTSTMQANSRPGQLLGHRHMPAVLSRCFRVPKPARLQLSKVHSASTDIDTTAATVTYSFDSTADNSPAHPSPPTSSPDVVTQSKLALLEQVAALDRGALATHADKENIERLVRVLEQHGSPSEPLSGSPAPVEGRWELMYTNKEVFRASPFFLAFQNGLVQNKELSEAIFKFTDAIPGAEIGAAYQTISLLSGSLISEVQMTVFPGFTGTVVTSSRAVVQSSNQLGLMIESTRVTGSTFSPFLDSIAVPVEQLINQLRGEGSTAAVYEITYVDPTMRVTRAGDQLLVHRRAL